MRKLSELILIAASCATIPYGFAADQQKSVSDESTDASPPSPWLFIPLITSAPKLGTSAGGLAGYVRKFDAESPPSLFLIKGTYSNTESISVGAFARMHFDQDKQRLLLGVVHGEVNNEYADYLGTGYEVKTKDNIYAAFARYTYRIKNDWFIGPQLLSTDYAVSGSDWFSQDFLNGIGLTGFNSNGLGLVIERDTRDNQFSPSSGALINLNNVAYREQLGGDYSFDAYALTANKYHSHGKANVLAARIDGRWTNDAPSGGYSSIRLRGYTTGQYLAPHATLFEIEERYVIRNRWGGTFFGGVACLYGNNQECFDSDNIYPSIGAGITYTVKVKEKMVARAEFAKGKEENYGVYLKFGYEF